MIFWLGPSLPHGPFKDIPNAVILGGTGWIVGCLPGTLVDVAHYFFVLVGNALPETNIAPENGPGPKRKIIFQPSIFRGYVSFREGNFLKSGSNIIPA